MNTSDVITVPEAAKLLGISDTATRALCKRGKLEGARPAGRLWLIPRSAVVARAKLKKKGRLSKGGRPPKNNPE